MRKLIVTCDCGQRLQVPYSALGKMGLCPSCGNKVRITPEGARRDGPRKHGDAVALGNLRDGSGLSFSEEAKHLFGRAVDLFSEGHYAEALAIFDSFAEQFPDNPDIQEAREHCLNALKRVRPTKPGQLPFLSGGSRPDTAGAKPDLAGASLDAETVRRVVLEKMLYGSTETIQLEAAKIACRMLGLFDHDEPAPESSEKGTNQEFPHNL